MYLKLPGPRPGHAKLTSKNYQEQDWPWHHLTVGTLSALEHTANTAYGQLLHKACACNNFHFPSWAIVYQAEQATRRRISFISVLNNSTCWIRWKSVAVANEARCITKPTDTDVHQQPDAGKVLTIQHLSNKKWTKKKGLTIDMMCYGLWRERSLLIMQQWQPFNVVMI